MLSCQLMLDLGEKPRKAHQSESRFVLFFFSPKRFVLFLKHTLRAFFLLVLANNSAREAISH